MLILCPKYAYPAVLAQFGVVLDSLILDFQAARRWAELRKILVQLHNASTQKWGLLYDEDLMTDLCGLKGGGESCKTTTYDKYAVASH